jgi:hypothetical protein
LKWSHSGESYKRLERGRFWWPKAGGEAKLVLSAEELAMLIGGIDLELSKRRAWYRRPAGMESGSNICEKRPA